MKLTKREINDCARGVSLLRTWILIDKSFADATTRQGFMDEAERLLKLREKLKRGLK